ncbi:hypothetical protein PI124_g6746 [Phytophthora idaei]|nr:hypothetical protein PI125_g13366 [Phytophthora idaei]KAG3149319.1 hypothetical protein PI126_g12060 [Phytophthora idaei]KAG3248576.1 hypothetical protein PI124_g6746 [Phytophthora idaei]
MQLSHVFVVIAAIFLASSEALSHSNVASSSIPNQRLLRTHHGHYADEEERIAPLERVNSLAKRFGLDLQKAKTH